MMEDAPPAPGFFIAIVGPSGVGKDTLIAGLSAALPSPSFSFPQRIITRRPDMHEQSLFLDEEAFEQASAAGEFLISWEANGHSYALSRSVATTIGRGRHVIANVSRKAVPALRDRLPRLLVVHVSARAEIIADRLRARGRESSDVQLQRLERGVALDSNLEADIRIENNGPVERSVEALLKVVSRLPVVEAIAG
jgi:ribose 1,5-bisphosphokinase